MIPVFEPDISEEDIRAVADAVRRGEISGSFGESIPSFEREFASYCGRRHGVSVTSGTTALQLAVAALGIGPGDEVLVSASTNIATALAVYHLGAVAVPVDSEYQTWNLDVDLIDSLVSPRTKAIIPVHLFGHPVPMDRLCEVAARHGLSVIEDCAESHGATWNGRRTGAFGELACFSFYANKIITTGEGGMIVTDDDVLAERMRLLRNLAFAKPRFLHEHAGYNFRMTGMQAALGRSQLKRINSFIAQKRRVAATYNRMLAGIGGLRTPPEMSGAMNVYWMYAVTIGPKFGLDRDQLAEHLRANGVDTRTFFCPMNQQPFLRRQTGFRDVPCPVADQLWCAGLYLPSACSLRDDTIAKICDFIRQAAANH